LKESSDIERICAILDSLVNKANEFGQQKRKLLEIIFDIVIPKYCSGDYGIDESDLTKYCVLHTLIMKFT